MSDTTITFNQDELNAIIAALWVVRWSALQTGNKAVADSTHKALTRFCETNPRLGELIEAMLRDVVAAPD
jgi:hypothetical protein